MKTVTDYFGSLVFDDRVMKATLSAKVYVSKPSVGCKWCISALSYTQEVILWTQKS